MLRRKLIILALVPLFSFPTTSMALELGGGRVSRDFKLGYDIGRSLAYKAPTVSPTKITTTPYIPPTKTAPTSTPTPTKTSTPVARAPTPARSAPAYTPYVGAFSFSFVLPGRRSGLSDIGIGLRYDFSLPKLTATPKPPAKKIVKPVVAPKKTAPPAPKKPTPAKVTPPAPTPEPDPEKTASVSLTIEPTDLEFDLGTDGPLPGLDSTLGTSSLTFSGEGTGEVSPTETTGGEGTLMTECSGECGAPGEKVSEPGTLLFLGFGLMGFVAVNLRRRRQQI